MTRLARTLLATLACIVPPAFAAAFAPASDDVVASDRPPNVVIVFTDDQGWAEEDEKPAAADLVSWSIITQRRLPLRFALLYF